MFLDSICVGLLRVQYAVAREQGTGRARHLPTRLEPWVVPVPAVQVEGPLRLTPLPLLPTRWNQRHRIRQERPLDLLWLLCLLEPLNLFSAIYQVYQVYQDQIASVLTSYSAVKLWSSIMISLAFYLSTHLDSLNKVSDCRRSGVLFSL